MKPQMPRYIPSNSTAVESPNGHGTVYTYEQAGKVYAIAFSGKRSKSDWHINFGTNAQRRQEYIAEYFSRLEAHAKSVIDRRAERSKPHTIAVGTIVYNSWGYDQTNVDFYEVVKTSANFVWLQKLNSELVPDAGCGPMSGHVKAVPGTAHGELKQHRAGIYGSGNYVNFKHGGGSIWDGQPKYCSWYA